MANTISRKNLKQEIKSADGHGGYHHPPRETSNRYSGIKVEDYCQQASTYAQSMPDSFNNLDFYVDERLTMEHTAVPRLVIVSQPSQKFRFRYHSEKPGSHGTLTSDKEASNHKKEHPTVKVDNCLEPVRITASLVTADHKPHVHQLVGTNCKEGICIMDVDKETCMQAVFHGMGIEHRTKNDVTDTLFQRKKNCYIQEHGHVSEQTANKLRREAEQEKGSMDLNVVCIRFDAVTIDRKIPFSPVFSTPIKNLKSAQSGELKICQMDKYSSVCTGDERVFLLCEKVKKNDIEIHFYEEGLDGEIVWQAKGSFNAKDVHRQFAIVFKTPPYRNLNISESVQVFIQLYRPSSGEYSEAKEFSYKPKITEDFSHIARKKMKLDFADRHPQVNEGRNANTITSQRGSQQFDMGNQQQFQQQHPQFQQQLQLFQQQHQQHTFTQPGMTTAHDPMLYSGAASSAITETQLDLENLINNSNIASSESSLSPYFSNDDDEPLFGMDVVSDSMKISDETKTIKFVPPRQGFETHAASALPIKERQLGGALPPAAITERRLGEALPKPAAITERRLGGALPKPAAITERQLGGALPKSAAITERRLGGALPEQVALTERNNRLIRKYWLLNQYIITGQVSFLLADMKNAIGLEDNNGNNGILRAVFHENPSAAIQMIDQVHDFHEGKVLNHRNRLFQTALHASVLMNMPTVTAQLLHWNCDVRQTDANGNTALHLASFKSLACLETLLRDIKPERVVNDIVNKKNFDGMTPLHLSVVYGTVDHVNALLLNHADINIPEGKCGKYPIHLSIECRNFIITRRLLSEKDVEVNCRTYNGDTPLHYAVFHDAPLDIVAEMRLVGADPSIGNFECASESEEDDSFDSQKLTPLDLASSDELRALLSKSIEELKDEKSREKASPAESSLSSEFQKMKVSTPAEDDGYHSKEMKSLDDEMMCKLSNLLDPPVDDWKNLMYILDFDSQEQQLKQDDSPTKAMLLRFFNEGRGMVELCNAFEALMFPVAKSIVEKAIKRSQ